MDLDDTLATIQGLLDDMKADVQAVRDLPSLSISPTARDAVANILVSLGYTTSAVNELISSQAE
jgi:hypothetical protein